MHFFLSYYRFQLVLQLNNTLRNSDLDNKTELNKMYILKYFNILYLYLCIIWKYNALTVKSVERIKMYSSVISNEALNTVTTLTLYKCKTTELGICICIPTVTFSN